MSTATIRAAAGFNDWNHVLNLIIAEDQGYFSDEGISVKRVITGSDDNTAKALAAGEIDVSVDATAKLLLKYRSLGKSVCVVGARRRNSGFVLFGPPGARSIHDLRGKTISSTHPGGESDTQIRILLKRAGLVPDRDIMIQYEMDTKHENWALVDELLSGKVDAIILAPIKAMEEKISAAGYSVIADLRAADPPRQDRLLAANKNFARENRGVLKSFLKAFIRTNLLLKDRKNRNEVLAIIRRAGFDESEEHFETLYAPLLGYRFQPDASVHEKGFEMMAEEEKSFGRIPESFNPAEILFLEPLKEAQKELGLA